MRSIWVGLFSAGCVAVGASSGCGGGVTSDTAGQGAPGARRLSSATTGHGRERRLARRRRTASGTDTDYHARTCVQGRRALLHHERAQGTPLPTQTPGDCRRSVRRPGAGRRASLTDSDSPGAGTFAVAPCMSRGCPSTNTAVRLGTVHGSTAPARSAAPEQLRRVTCTAPASRGGASSPCWRRNCRRRAVHLDGVQTNEETELHRRADPWPSIIGRRDSSAPSCLSLV